MKVKELIERLKTADPENEVLINTYDSTLDIVGVITHYEDEPVIIETVEDKKNENLHCRKNKWRKTF